MSKHIFSIAYMFIATLFFTSLVSGVKFFNEERIQRNQALKLQKVILHVLGIQFEKEAKDERLLNLFKRRVKEMEVGEKTVYVGYESDVQTIQGYAFPISGPGFWGPIYGIAAVDSRGSKITGLAFYKHSETPGLGGRITEPWFTQQFVGLELSDIPQGEQIFSLKPPGTQKGANELDAITGATGTSRAINTFVNLELKTFLQDTWKALKTHEKLHAETTQQFTDIQSGFVEG